jgi:hypothetical protein
MWGRVHHPWTHAVNAAGCARHRAHLCWVGMTGFLTILLAIALLGVLGVLGAGIIGVVRGGDPVRSNRLMRWRVILQGLVLVIFVLLILSRH